MYSCSYAYYYDTKTKYAKEEFHEMIFSDLYYPSLDYSGRQERDSERRELFFYNKYINEITKATQITIDINNTKLISGYPDGTFRPDDKITKAEFLKMAIGLSVNRNFDFSAIPSNGIRHWAAQYVAVAEMQNVVDVGDYSDDNLNEAITRLEMIEILSRIQINMKGISQYRDAGDLNYSDMSILTDEEKGYLLHAARYELIEGMLDSGVTEIRPYDPITRGEAARAIIRVY